MVGYRGGGDSGELMGGVGNEYNQNTLQGFSKIYKILNWKQLMNNFNFYKTENLKLICFSISAV